MARWRFLRDFEAGRYLDLMLVSAITAVLLIRFFLAVTGYPKLGGSALHVAHVLWGGLLMLAALVILLSSLGRGMHALAAMIGGAGFGTFIDEVGKFVTHDNDYFYAPAVSIIYVVFGLLYLTLRWLRRSVPARQEENLANALEEVMEVAGGDLDRGERDRAQELLQRCSDRYPIARQLAVALDQAELVAPPRPGLPVRLGARLVTGYQRIATSRWFGAGVVLFFLVQLLLKLLRLTALARVFPEQRYRLLQVPLVSSLPVRADDYSLVHWLQLGSSLLAGVFVASGLWHLFRNRLRALRMFRRATQITIFLTMVFVFYRVEWWALGELTFNLLLLAALHFAITHEVPHRRR